MGKVIAPTGRQVQYNGTHGNLSVASLVISAAAVAAGDNIVMGEFDTKIEVVDYRLDHDNLGAGTSVDIGFGYIGDTADEVDVIADGLSTAAAGSKRMAKQPVTAKEHSQLFITPRGSAINGDITLTVFYTNNA